jgi:exosortase E/protease (VPEID-CTERM system)
MTPIAVLGVEYLALSIAVDLPISGPAMTLVAAIRVAIPVAISAVIAGALIAGTSAVSSVPLVLPPWRPWRAIAAQLAAFGVTAAIAYRVFHPEASPAGTAIIVLLSVGSGLTIVFAAFIVAPPRSVLAAAASTWRLPILACALGVLTWRAAHLAEGLWGALTAITLHSVGWTLSYVSDAVTLDVGHRLVGVGAFVVHIAPICSGADGLGLVVVFQALWISLAREHLHVARALVLMPLGAVAAIVANIARISALTVVGGSGREDLAISGFHSKLGWLLFIAIALGGIALAERVRWFHRDPTREMQKQPPLPDSAAVWVGPFLAVLAAALLTSVWTTGPLDRAYGARVAAGLIALFAARRSLPRFAFGTGWIPVAIATATCAAWVMIPARAGEDLATAVAALGPVERAAWVAARIVGSCLVVPIVEELAFRGFLLPWLVAPDFQGVSPRAWTWSAVVGSSLAFGAMHEQWALASATGGAFAAARLWRGRLADAVVAHALVNVGIACAVLFAGRWDLWT